MPPNKKQNCFNDLRLRILSMDIAAGCDLDEQSLSKQYDISRTPMREVFQRLAGEGYISLEENRGAKVASMDLSQLRVFFQTAPLIYANIARLAAVNRTLDQLADLKSAQKEFHAATQAQNPSDTALANHRFHEIIGEMAHNPYLVASLNRMLIDHTRLSQIFYRPASAHEKVLVGKASEQHDSMIIAIEAKEPALATNLTLEHWDLSRDRLERFVQPDPLPIDVSTLKVKQNEI